MLKIACLNDVFASSSSMKSVLLLLMTLYGVMAAEPDPNRCLKCQHETVKAVNPTNKTRAEETIKKHFLTNLVPNSNCLTLTGKIEEVGCLLSGRGACELKSIKVRNEIVICLSDLV